MMSCLDWNESATLELATAPSGDKMLSGLPSQLRSKPSLNCAIWSDEMTSCWLDVSGLITTSSGLHSAAGVNAPHGVMSAGAFMSAGPPVPESELQPIAATPDRPAAPPQARS